MKKTQTPKKLSLHRETVRQLESFALREVQGGLAINITTLSSSPSGEDCCITR